ncbi:hypothetical protein C8046_17050 [Serinibacter arcticus]|uniref:Uncharacterized protein n=1 Tax=Serinibacter arcticus TaxID=1655435 RepID=A0A2U1ZYM6_9MICO|nr:hypothetical protein C8046_17050 [Serinibacter arcticus]
MPESASASAQVISSVRICPACAMSDRRAARLTVGPKTSPERERTRPHVTAPCTSSGTGASA